MLIRFGRPWSLLRGQFLPLLMLGFTLQHHALADGDDLPWDFQSPRQTVGFDEGWRFREGDHTGAEAARIRRCSMGAYLNVPHDWAIKGPFDEENPARGDGGFLPTGVGWYRKHFELPQALNGKRVYIEFDGIMANSDVWINGHHLGHRPNGYVSFRYDLTDHVEFGRRKSNVIAVRADTSAQVASRWYTGSGIYRHVRLVCVDPVHFDLGGVFAMATSIEEKRATLKLQLAVRNQQDKAKEVLLKTVLLDPEGQEVAAKSSKLNSEAKAEIQKPKFLNSTTSTCGASKPPTFIRPTTNSSLMAKSLTPSLRTLEFAALSFARIPVSGSTVRTSRSRASASIMPEEASAQRCR